MMCVDSMPMTAIAAPIAIVIAGLAGGPVAVRAAGLDDIGQDPRRAYYVEALIQSDGVASLVDAYVADVPPGVHLADPPQLLVEYLGLDGSVLMRRNAADPRVEFSAGEDGHEQAVELDAGLAEIGVEFRHQFARVRVSDQQTLPAVVLLDANIRPGIEAYCDANRQSPPCEGFEPEVRDSDGDSIPDSLDRCPGTVFPEPPVVYGTLRTNRWALGDDGRQFVQADPQRGSPSPLAIDDTAGCGCVQILREMGVSRQQERFGCPTGALREWIEFGAGS